MRRLYLFLLRLLQKRCKHPSYAVTADLCEGDFWHLNRRGRTEVKYCNICGAVRFVFRYGWDDTPKIHHDDPPTEWRQPRPDWIAEKEERHKRFLRACKEKRLML